MSVLNQIILGILLMVTLIVVALMARIYSKTGSDEPLKQKEHATPPIEEPETEPDEA